MNPDITIILPILTAAGSMIIFVKFWMDMGETKVRAKEAAELVQAAMAKIEMNALRLYDFKVEAANIYATSSELKQVELQLGSALVLAMQGVYDRLDRTNERLDSLLAQGRNNKS